MLISVLTKDIDTYSEFNQQMKQETVPKTNKKIQSKNISCDNRRKPQTNTIE